MQNYARLIAILQRLIAYRTVSSDSAAVDACLDYIEDSTAASGLTVNRYVSNGFQSLVLSTQRTLRPTVILQAHIDVVPGYDHQFKLQQKEGKLYGRGVYDMKFAAACFVYLLEDLEAELGSYNFAVMLTSDEEVNGRNGVEYLLNQGYTGQVCVLPDSGDDWNIEANAKGFLAATISVRGRSGHGSRPWESDNAAIKLTEFITEVGQAFPPASPLETTVSLTMLSAGSVYNQIPGDASATLDIRFPDEAACRQVQKKLTALCAKHDVEVAFSLEAQAIQHRIDSEYFDIWQTGTRKIIGRSPTFTTSFAGSDARYFVPRGIPTISARPKGGGHHGGEEWLAEKDFYQYYDLIKYFVQRTARQQIDL